MERYTSEVRQLLKMAGMTDKEINQEEVKLAQHEKDVFSGKIPTVEPSAELQAKFDSGGIKRLGS